MAGIPPDPYIEFTGVVDFTADQVQDHSEQDYYFYRDNQHHLKQDESKQTSRDTCPSPKKKQRMVQKNCDSEKVPTRPGRVLRPKTALVVPDNKSKSSEELELEKIEAKRLEFAKAKKLHDAAYKKAIAKGNPVTMKSVQPPTLPQEFNFRSDQRIKGTHGKVEEDKVENNFIKSLRSTCTETTNAKAGQSTTRPKPFKLTAAKNSSKSVPSLKKYVSMAEGVMGYEDGFRTNSRGTSFNRKRPASPGLTVPKTPALSTRGRIRSVKLPTREEQEEEEFEKHKSQAFKAHPVNQTILKEPQLGACKVIPKPTTTVKEFNLHTNHSRFQKHPKDPVEEHVPEFRAKGVNTKILEGPIGVKLAEKKPLTVAQSPAFSLKNRLRPREKLDSPPEERPAALKVKRDVPVGEPFKPQLDHKFTVPKPFAVEEHSKEMLKKKEQKIQQVLEEEKKAREFHASLLPSDSPDQLPAKKTKPVTTVEPFRLAVDERGYKYQEEWKSKQIEEEEEQARSKTKFHATSNKVIFKTPFVPEKCNRQLTEISSFTLNTDQRVQERANFEMRIKEHEVEIEALKRQREERKAKEESEAVAMLRQEMVHKATGIKKYKTVCPLPSDRPLTVAESPVFLTDKLRSLRVRKEDS